METISAYFSSIRKNGILTFDQEKELSNVVRKGGEDAQKAVDILVKSNLRFAISVARKYQGRGMDLEDLIGEANRGLISAAWKYDGNQGYRFCTYAVHWIKQSIMESLMKNSRTIRLPFNQIGNLNAVNKILGRVEREEGRVATSAEISRETGISLREVENLIKISKQSISLDKTINGDDDEVGTLNDIVAGDSDCEAEVNKTDLHEALIRLMKGCLTDREFKIIQELFGLECVARSLEDIAKELNVTAERIRQLQNSAMSKLRKSVGKRELLQFLG